LAGYFSLLFQKSQCLTFSLGAEHPLEKRFMRLKKSVVSNLVMWYNGIVVKELVEVGKYLTLGGKRNEVFSN
jgi:hypothetical protein